MRDAFFTTMFIDITETKKNTEVLENFLDVNLDLLCITDVHGNFVKTNHAWFETLGYSQEDLEKRNLLEFVHPDDLQSTNSTITHQNGNKEILNFTNRYMCKDGSYRYIEWRSQPHDDLIYVAARDVSSRVRDTKALQQQQEDLLKSTQLIKKISDQLPGVIYQYRFHPDGRNYFPFASDNIYHIYEVTPDEVKEDAGKVLKRLHPDDYESVIAKISKSFETLQIWEDDYRVLLPIRGERWLRGLARPEKLEDGSVLWHGYITDITERKQLDIEATRTQEQFALAIAGTNDGIWDWDLQTNALFLSPRWKDILGYLDHEVLNEFSSFMKMTFLQCRTRCSATSTEKSKNTPLNSE